MSRLTRDGTAEPVLRDQIFRHVRGQGNIIFPCSADHEQDWQPYPVDPCSAICDDHAYHTSHHFGFASTVSTVSALKQVRVTVKALSFFSESSTVDLLSHRAEAEKFVPKYSIDSIV